MTSTHVIECTDEDDFVGSCEPSWSPDTLATRNHCWVAPPRGRAGGLGNAIDVRGPGLAGLHLEEETRCFATQSANDRNQSAPIATSLNLSGLSGSSLATRSLTGEWPTGWKPLCTSLPSSPFMVSTKDMTREAPLVQADSVARVGLRFDWLRREVGPSQGFPCSRCGEACDPRFQAKITSPSRLPHRNPECRVVDPSLLEKVHRFPPLGGKRTVRGTRRSIAG